MSARAAWRLEQLGFTDVYDYALHRLGDRGLWTDVRGSIVADASTHDPPTAKVEETVGTARQRLDGETQVVVINDASVVVGVLRKESWDETDDARVGDAMRLGPGTVRPGAQLGPLVGRMEKRDVESVLVTDAEGRLIGVMTLESGRAILAGDVQSSFEKCESCPGWWRHRLVS